jgi:nitroimidazol reductase NimA-like FMN-containing flavoprotein (pyridoxamine 5'-phosphate oxidase superfamily)
MITTLSEVNKREVLESARVGRLGCIVDGEPYIVPINYKFEDDCIYSHSLPGLKIASLRKNPRVCLQVDQIESDFEWRSTLVFGEFEEIKDADQRSDILNRLLKRFPLLTPVESAIAVDAAAPEIIVFRIRIDRMSGVSEG